jgi:hypothetical protein
MGVITAAATPGAQSIIQVFKFTTITNGDTFAGPASPKAYWCASVAGTSSVTESSGTYTFTVGSTGAGYLFVIL